MQLSSVAFLWAVTASSSVSGLIYTCTAAVDLEGTLLFWLKPSSLDQRAWVQVMDEDIALHSQAEHYSHNASLHPGV